MDEYTYALEPTHCSELLACMDQQRKAKDESLCDIRLTVGDSCVYAHRCVLAVCSGYFQGLLSGVFCEAQEEGGSSSRMMEVDFTDCVSNIAHLDTLLSAVYTGSLKLSLSNVAELACFLLVERVRAVCEGVLLETLSFNNCLHYLKLADRYELSELFKACQQLLDSRFHDHFIHSSEMLTLSASCMERLPRIYRYVHLPDMIQFLAQWVDGKEGGGVVNRTEDRATRQRTACSLVCDRCRLFRWAKVDEISLQSLVRESDTMGQLLLALNLSLATQSPSCVLRGECSSNEAVDSSDKVGSLCCTSDSIHKVIQHAERDKRDNTRSDENSATQVDTQDRKQAGNNSDIRDKNISQDFHADPTKTDPVRVIRDVETSVSRTCDADSALALISHIPHGSSHNCAGGTRETLRGKRELDSSQCVSHHTAAKCMKPATESIATISDFSMNQVLVAFAPGKTAVKYFAATDCEKNRPRFCAIDFEVCVYDIHQERWLWAGTAVFPEKFEERDAWKLACVGGKAYFLSLPRQTLHVLDLQTVQWSQLNCRLLLDDLSANSKVRSLVPIAVDDQLYVLASDKQRQVGGGTFLTLQRYFRLEDGRRWQPVTDVQHSHMATPLSVLSVSQGKVYVVKANIAVNLEKSMLMVQEGHVFDSVKGKVSKFHATTCATSPMRVLAGDGEVHMVDGDGFHRQLMPDLQCWDVKQQDVDLSDIKKARAASGESYLPCLTHCSAVMGSSAWEFSSFRDTQSSLTELHLHHNDCQCNSKDGSGVMFTVRHPPPPFRYVTIMTACQLSSEFVSSLKPCHYLHADVV